MQRLGMKERGAEFRKPGRGAEGRLGLPKFACRFIAVETILFSLWGRGMRGGGLFERLWEVFIFFQAELP